MNRLQTTLKKNKQLAVLFNLYESEKISETQAFWVLIECILPNSDR